MYATVKIRCCPNRSSARQGSADDPSDKLSSFRAACSPCRRTPIDTGAKIVYREVSPSLYEGVAVQLGPRMSAENSSLVYHAILTGLRAGDRIVTNGSFLIDAETRLNPAAGSIYGDSGRKGGQSGAFVRPSTPAIDDSRLTKAAALKKLGTQDRQLAEAQAVCPITGRPLGSMGIPAKMTLGGQPIFLCCEACEARAKANEESTLARVNDLKARAR